MDIVVVNNVDSGVDSDDEYYDDECMINGKGIRHRLRGWITIDELRIVCVGDNWIKPNRLWYIDCGMAGGFCMMIVMVLLHHAPLHHPPPSPSPHLNDEYSTAQYSIE